MTTRREIPEVRTVADNHSNARAEYYRRRWRKRYSKFIERDYKRIADRNKQWGRRALYTVWQAVNVFSLRKIRETYRAIRG